MDKLLKLSQEHGEIFESIAFFKEALSVARIAEEPKRISEFNILFQEYVAGHFHYEESKIFPLVLKSGLLEAQQLVRELQIEHIQIYAKLDLFKSLFSSLKGKPDAAGMKRIAAAAQEIIKLALAHARKEDSRFFPLVKKLNIQV
jgi:hemerythrin-like domain-containing protein